MVDSGKPKHTPGAIRATIALRKELSKSSIGSWFVDGQGKNDEHNALVKFAAALIDRETGCAEMLAALQKIADNYGGCHCDHSTKDCCENSGEFCPHCIAELAIRKAVGDGR